MNVEERGGVEDLFLLWSVYLVRFSPVIYTSNIVVLWLSH